MSHDRGTPRAEPLDAAFERFVVSASPALLRSAFLLTGDRGHAEDLLQTVLLRTLRRWPAISAAPKSYAFEVLANLSRDRHRARGRRPREAPEAEVPARASGDAVRRLLDRDEIVQAALQLVVRQREVLACRFLLDLSVAETAAALGVPEGTVKSDTARALERMRVLLADDPVASRGGRAEVRNAE